ncbi:DUF3348 domain-containing protein [Burkholderia pseudomallei]|uniref:DUF3348 domain-containing protein n=4 Tax=Burkholderia pseudomallei TaxID=28450 RepID=UPI00070E4F71|nr:DUF3348 domain-containing protein [Burkholderia pseudomallei]ARL54572.1 hypothetical protein BOC51_34135 [Burkholderia pseudomallei]MBO7753800.1 DUF3348 domain-containing protein [Burkholderia pseudomallei]OMT49326.1 hypothetical protein AQ759_04470 [Burkholderia pseudomallei]OMT50871.1 hypothetical protein AQ761_15085 [Burkholderia pseudomallei]ONE01153.1 hypothetical protein AQ943_03415 [Burkholderia pseudomallei]
MLGRAAAAAAPRSLADAPPATPERAPIPSSRIAPKPPVARSTSRTPAHASPTCKLLPFFDIDTRRMMQVPQRSALGGPTLIRLLARLAHADVPPSGQSLSDRLSQWLAWTDAIALSSALSMSPPAAAAGARPAGDDPHGQGARVRASLAKAIARTGAFAAGRDGAARVAARGAPHDAPADFTLFRHDYLSMQQAMEIDIGELRGRLRQTMAAQTPAFARLAALDATMERALVARERSLFASVPKLLGAYFERLREAEQQRLAEAEAKAHANAEADAHAEVARKTAAPAPHAWLDAFRQDMQSVLLAELDIRFQPVDGLLAALRAS